MAARFKMARANGPGGGWPKTYNILLVYFVSDQGFHLYTYKMNHIINYSHAYFNLVSIHVKTPSHFFQILKIAKLITNSQNISTAVNLLKKLPDEASQWYNEEKFPENESNSNAFKQCIDEETAKYFCPVRYAAMEKWIAASRQTMSRVHPRFIKAFHVTGKNSGPYLMWGRGAMAPLKFAQNLRTLSLTSSTNCILYFNPFVFVY